MAILLALAHKDKLNILGITTVCGNQTLENVTENTLNILQYVNEDIKVYKGANQPIIRNYNPNAKMNGLGDIAFEKNMKKAENISAVEFIASELVKAESKITLVPTGPLTNIALLIKTYPHLLNKIEEISLMGGGITTGNITSASEFNFYVDPESAKIVFESGLKITMSGLDVTNKAYITNEECKSIKDNGKVSKLVSQLIEFYFAGGRRTGKNAIHDACAIAYLIEPSIFKSKEYHIQIITDSETCKGMTLADTRDVERKDTNANVLLEVDRERFKNLLFYSFGILDNRL